MTVKISQFNLLFAINNSSPFFGIDLKQSPDEHSDDSCTCKHNSVPQLHSTAGGPDDATIVKEDNGYRGI